MMLKISLLIIVFVIQILFLINFLKCQNFNSVFYVNPEQVNLQLIGDIHDDRSGNLFLVRIFHNKIYAYADAIYDAYLYYFTLPYLANTISVTGLYGIVIGFVYCGMRKNLKILLPLCIAVLLIPLFEVFSIQTFPVVISIFTLWFIFQTFSLISWYYFLPQKIETTKYITLLILIIISIIWLFAPADLLRYYCGIT